MKENISMEEKNIDDQQEQVHDLIPDRDILMMEKPMADNRASRFRPADKKRLRSMIVLLLFVVAILITLMVVVRSGERDNGSSTVDPVPQEGILTPGTE
jgi:hypothetical protein